MRRVSWSNVGVALLALLVGRCTAAEGQDHAYVFRGLEPIVPNALVRGVWYEVEGCLQIWDLSPDDIRWAVADYIVEVDEQRLLYGVTAYVNWPDGRMPTIVVDRTVKDNALVLSHEMVHAIGKVPDGHWKLHVCTLDSNAYYLPPRPLTDEQLAELVETH